MIPALKPMAGFACALLLAPPALADQVLLDNGDRISGRILHMGKDKLDIRTPYAGKLSLRRKNVQSILSERPVDVLRASDDAVLHGRLAEAPAGSLTVVDEGDTRNELVLADVAFLNPTIAESGRGIIFKGRANLALSSTGGNNETRRLYGESSLTGTARHYRFSISGRGEEQQDHKRTDAFNWRLAGDLDRFREAARKRFWYGRASLAHDRFADVRLRAALGAGHGWQLLDAPPSALSLRLGGDLVAVRRVTGEDDRYPALGWGLRWNRALGRGKAELFHEQDGFMEIGHPSNVTVISKTGLRLPLIDNLNASAQLNYDWEGKPAEGRHPGDSALFLGLGYDW